MLIEELVCGYGRLRILWAGRIELKPGNTSLIVGHNGSGKSTFLKTISRVIPPLSGKVPEGLTTVLLPEELDLPGNLSPASIYSSLCPWETERSKILELLGIPARKSFFKLSKGNRQKFRVAVAESLASRLGKSVLCLDEPLSGLDVSARAQITEAWSGRGGLGEIWGRFHGHRLISQHSGIAPSSVQTLVAQSGTLSSFPPMSSCDNWPEAVSSSA